MAGNEILKSRGELYLVLGLAVLSLATAVCQFVIWGLLAWLLVPIALTLLSIGVIRVKGTRRRGVSLQRQAVGFVLLIFGIAALLFAAWETSLLAYEVLIHWERPSRPTPSMGDWLFVTMGWVLPAGLTGFGFWCWTGWSFRRCRNWAIAVFFVCPASLLVVFTILDNLGVPVSN